MKERDVLPHERVDIQLKNVVKISRQRKLGYLRYLTFLSFEINFKYKINYYES